MPLTQNRRTLLQRVPLLAALVTVPAWVQGQTYPAKPIRFVIPVSAGGGADTLGRTVTERWGRVLNQTFVVDNQAGGGGAIASQNVARAVPDGYTLLMAYVATHGTGPATRKLGYDAVKDFSPIGMIGATANVLVVNSNLPVNTLKEFLAYLKANPGKLSYAGSTPGSLQRLAGELLKKTAGIDMLYVPYKGTGAVIPDLLGGRLDAAIDNVLVLAPFIRKGQLRGIGVTSTKRSVVFPELPTLAETGVPGFNAVGWFGLFTAAKTPQPIITRLNTEISALLQEPQTRDRLLAQGAEPLPGPPGDLRNHLAREIDVWSKVIREAGIKAE